MSINSLTDLGLAARSLIWAIRSFQTRRTKMVLDVHPPHLLFLGDIKNPLDAKTAMGVLEWRSEHCIGQFRLPGCEIDLGLPDLSPAEAFEAGAKSLLIGVAPLGGEIAPEWMESIRLSLASGLSVVSGLHQKLTAVNGLKSIADAEKVALVDVRMPPDVHRIASGKKRTGKRLLTVGTDCCVGKKYTALAVWKALAKQGVDVTFRATGQTGIMISGQAFQWTRSYQTFCQAFVSTSHPTLAKTTGYY